MKNIKRIIIMLLALIMVVSYATADTFISARKWMLVQVEFDKDINPATDILIKESKWKSDYHLDKADMAFNTNVLIPIPETEDEINECAIIEWQVIDSSTGFNSGDEAIKATLIYFDGSGRWLPELDGLDPIEARKYNAVFYSHRKWDYNASKIVTVSDRVQFLGGAKFRVGFFEEYEECYDEEGNLEVITFRTYGLIPGADFSKSGGKSSGGGKPSGGGSTGLVTPTPPPTETPTESPTATPPPESNEPDPQEDPIETLAPRNTPTPSPNEPAPKEDDIILAPRSDGKESSAPTAESSSTNVETSSSSSSETTNTTTTETTTTTSETTTSTSAETSSGTPDSNNAGGEPNQQEDEIVLVPRGGG